MKIIFEKGDNEYNYANYVQRFFRGQIDGLDIRIVPSKVTIKKNSLEIEGLPEAINLSEDAINYTEQYICSEIYRTPLRNKYDIEIKIPTEKDELE